MHYDEKNPLTNLNKRSIASPPLNLLGTMMTTFRNPMGCVNFNFIVYDDHRTAKNWFTIKPTKTKIQYGQMHAQIRHGILTDIGVTILDTNEEFYVFDETLRGFHEPGYEGHVEPDDAPLLPIDLLKNACQFIEDSLTTVASKDLGGE